MFQEVPLGKQMELASVFCVEDLAGVASCFLSLNNNSSKPPTSIPKHTTEREAIGREENDKTTEMFHKFASLKLGRHTNNSVDYTDTFVP